MRALYPDARRRRIVLTFVCQQCGNPVARSSTTKGSLLPRTAVERPHQSRIVPFKLYGSFIHNSMLALSSHAAACSTSKVRVSECAVAQNGRIVDCSYGSKDRSGAACSSRSSESPFLYPITPRARQTRSASELSTYPTRLPTGVVNTSVTS
jgi:hypothetical protein